MRRKVTERGRFTKSPEARIACNLIRGVLEAASRHTAAVRGGRGVGRVASVGRARTREREKGTAQRERGEVKGG